MLAGFHSGNNFYLSASILMSLNIEPGQAPAGSRMPVDGPAQNRDLEPRWK